MKYVLQGGKVIDGTGSKPKDDVALIVEGNKILEITSKDRLPKDAQIVDVSGKTLMPGLIDCHLHFATWHMFYATRQNHSLIYYACETVKAMKLALEAGLTNL